MNATALAEKIRRAEEIIAGCTTICGICASPDRYRGEAWTRDFGLAIAPLLIERGNVNPVVRHLNALVSRAKTDWSIPVLYLADENAFLRNRIQRALKKSAASGKPTMGLMLRSYLDGTLHRVTPRTRDSEIVFAAIAGELLRKRSDLVLEPHRANIRRSSASALGFVQNELKETDPDTGFVLGPDWRDTRDDLDVQPVLTNACILYRAASYVDKTDIVVCTAGRVAIDDERIKKNVVERYWDETKGYFVDFPDEKDLPADECYPDLVGNSLAVLYGIASPDQASRLKDEIASRCSSEFGFVTRGTTLPPQSDEEKAAAGPNGDVVWPWVSLLCSLMMITSGPSHADLGKLLFDRVARLDGFHEWYDVREGKGWGSTEQAWSAALFLRVADALSQQGQKRQ